MIRKITLLIAIFAITLGNAQNLAAGKTTASSFVVTDPAQPGPATDTSSDAVDGNMATRWESQHTDMQWWSVDLGASYHIGQVIIYWEGSYGSEFKIQISSDNATWTDLYTETAGNGGTDDISVDGTGRYVRYYGTARAIPYGHSFWEFEVYEYIDTSIDANLSDLTVNGTTVDGFTSSKVTYNIELPIGTTTVPTVVGTPKQASANAATTNALALPGTTTVLVTAQDGSTTKTYTLNFTVDKENIALGKTAMASTGTANLAFDGDANSRWESDATDTEWIYVDLDGTYDVEGVNISWEGAYGKEYSIEVSDDATNWTSVYDETAGDGGIDDISFTPTSAKYVRMNGKLRGTPYAFSIFEFEIYGALDSALSLDNAIENIEFSVAPNPTSGIININSNIAINSVEVYDINGRILISTKSNTIDLSSHNNGLYILKITTENGVVKTSKLIKQ